MNKKKIIIIAIVVVLIIALAIEVFPIPGLPYKIIENNFLFLTRLYNILSSPTKCFCPITSFNELGASFNARGLSILSLSFFSHYFIKKYCFFKDIDVILYLWRVSYG